MEYSLSLSDDGQYIVIDVVGDFTRAEAAEITQAAFEMGQQLGIRFFLNDVTKARNIERVVENVKFAKEDRIEAPAGSTGPCTAVLVDPADHSHDFFVAFAQRQGIDIALFWDREQAVKHLREAAARFGGTNSINPG